MRSLSLETKAALASPLREFKARVEVHRASTLVGVYSQADAISKIEIERVAQEGKFFGVGVCQKAKLTLVNKDRSFEVKKGDRLKISFGILLEKSSTPSEESAIVGEAVVGKAVVGTGRVSEDVVDYIEFPSFWVDSVVFDDVKQQVSIEAYDIIYKLQSYTVKDLDLKAPYSTKDFCLACARKVGTTCSIDDSLSIEYTKGGNFSGTESLRAGFDAAVESIGCVYYAKDSDVIAVQPLNKEKGITIDGANYFTATKSDKYQVGEVASITELGDNTVYTPAREGVRQNIQENAFLTYMESAQLNEQLERIYNAVATVSLSQYALKWRGNLALEPFDEIEIETTRYGTIVSTISNDVIVYNGGITETSSWTYVENDNTEANLSTVISRTFARVDKANNTITLLAGEISDINNKYSEIELTVDGITSTVNSQNEKISKVEQTADSITSTVSAQNEKISKIEQTSSSIVSQIEDVEGNINTIEQTLEGVAFKSSLADGTTVVNGGCITTNSISFDSFDSGAQSKITSAESTAKSSKEIANEALESANSSLGIANSANSTAAAANNTAAIANSNVAAVANTVDSWTYSGTTQIDGSMIATDTILASRLLGGTVQLMSSKTQVVGSLTIQYTTTGYGLGINTSYGGIQMNSGGNIYLSSSRGGNLLLGRDPNTNTYVCSLTGGYLVVSGYSYGTSAPSGTVPPGSVYFQVVS